MTTSENRNWPHEATDRVHQLLGQLAAKELECHRLREELRRSQEGLSKAVADEREACADEADCWIGFDKSASQACDDIAAAIRSRGAYEPGAHAPGGYLNAGPPDPPQPADEPWMSSYSVRLGRDKADCTDLVYTTVGQHEFQLYPHEAAYLRDLLNAALPPSATPQPQALPELPSTPSSHWKANGEPDPHDSGYYDQQRARLCMGELTDDELANGAFMNYDRHPSVAEMVAGKPTPMVWMTAVKDRIRWLSRALEKALASQPPAPADAGRVVPRLWLWKNFVDGRPEYWAFDNAFPVHLDCGDPQTLGEPCGYALLKPSRDGRPGFPDDEVLRRIASAKEI